jgi:hypothetical protein
MVPNTQRLLLGNHVLVLMITRIRAEDGDVREIPDVAVFLCRPTFARELISGSGPCLSFQEW